MAKDNLSVSLSLLGMNKSTHAHLLDEKSYTHARNANLDTDLEGMALTNEHSNILCNKLISENGKEQVIVGYKLDILTNRMILFLTDKEVHRNSRYDPDRCDSKEYVRESQIGYIPLHQDIEDASDPVTGCGCDLVSLLSKPLEEFKDFVETCTYIKIIGDCAESNYCLNFDPNYPIRDVVLKREACGTTMVFASKNNPPRYINIDNVSDYKYKGRKSSCGNTEDTCIDCEKLLLFPNFGRFNIIPNSITNGGNLRMGKYEFYAAYCDNMGRELSEYIAATTPVHIFDVINRRRDATMLHDRTTMGIHLQLEDVDDRFNYIKVVVGEISQHNKDVTYFVVGVYPTTTSSIYYNTNAVDSSNERINVEVLGAVKPVYKNFGGVVSSNGYLFGYDYNVQKEINLQKIANLMGSFAKWTTFESGEDLYIDGVNNALYRGYFRDEVYPFGIRFSLKNGYKTKVFPLISRPPRDFEVKEVSANTDVNSIKSSYLCNSDDRTKYWQYYNTAEDIGNARGQVRGGVKKIVTAEEEGYCKDNNAIILENGKITMNMSDDYTNLEDWIRIYSEEIKNTDDEDSDFYSPDLKDILNRRGNISCAAEDMFNSLICDGGDCENKYCDPSSASYDVERCNNIKEYCNGGECHSVCSTPVLVEGSDVIKLEELIENRTVKLERKLPGEEGDKPLYVHGPAPENCKQFHVVGRDRKETDDIREKLSVTFTDIKSTDDDCVSDLEIQIPYIHNRTDLLGNKSCSTAAEINQECNYFTPAVYVAASWAGPNTGGVAISNTEGETVYLDPRISTDDLLAEAHKMISTDLPGVAKEGFGDKILKGHLFYKTTFTDQDDMVIEIVPSSKREKHPDYIVNNKVRITVFDDCKSTEYISSDVFNLKEGYWLRLRRSDFGKKGNVIIVLDTVMGLGKMIDKTSFTQDCLFFAVFSGIPVYTSVPEYSFAIRKVPKQYYKQEIYYDKIRFSHSQKYISECKYSKSDSHIDCVPSPHKEGIFSYWESKIAYPDNCDLYDSSNIKLDVDRLKRISNNKQYDVFEEYFLEGSNTTNQNANFINKPIRHFKFPDNKVAPFMNTVKKRSFDSSMIYPMGITIDDEIVSYFLDQAVSNNIIDKCTRDQITHYEIFGGDRITKSVLARGLVHDMYKVSEEKGDVYFRNFPYNALGENIYITESPHSDKNIKHPNNNSENSKFSFVSPEVYVSSKPLGFTEITVDGFQFGNSEGTWKDVQEHSGWVMLGEKAKRQASNFANLEVAFEILSMTSTLLIDASKNGWFVAGMATGGGITGKIEAITSLISFAAGVVNLYTFKKPKLENEWLQIAEDNGPVSNHAEYYVSQRGYYNRFLVNDKEDFNWLRGVDKTLFLNNGVESSLDNTGRAIYINNVDRESSIYISTGDFNVKYPAEYVNWDNYDSNPMKSSRNTVGNLNKCNSKNPSHIANIASPYITLKRYIPDQYGNIDSIVWVHNGYIKKLGDGTDKTFFGGDAYITRVDLKNKFRLFHTDAVQMAPRTPFNYMDQVILGGPKYYVNYKIDSGLGGSLTTKYFSESSFRLDCFSGKEFYIRDRERFYLFSYGTPYFLVESTINNEYRYAGNEPHEQFASQGIDMVWHTQEVNVPIHSPVVYNYDSIYTNRNIFGLPGVSMESFFDKDKSDCWSNSENGIAWSQADNSEVSYNEPWLVFRPNDIYRFPFSFGKLKGLDTIESNVVVGRFSNNLTLFNSVDQLRDRVTSNNEYLGTGGIFASGRPIQFSYTDLGESGSQHRDFISTEFGHFFVDAKRGKVFKIGTGGQGLEAISDMKSGQESGMRRWFKMHLPFKILKSGIEGLTDLDLDNKYKGLGISLGWDSRFKRLFVTKLDYILRRKYRGKVSYSGGEFYLREVGQPEKRIDLQDDTYFKNVSWTLGYSCLYQCWVSYYDFKPDLYFSHDNYFQTVINYANSNHSRRGIWSHLLTNKSYQVFYGDYYPFEVEGVIKNTNTQNVLKDLKIWSFSHRYHDNFDYSQWRKKSFNKVVIHNHTNNSGLLNLYYDDSIHSHKYPIHLGGVSQGVKATHFDDHVSLNYFYNRVRSEDNGLPIWNSDENNIHYTLNPDAISFNSKRVLERLRGDWFKVLLIQDSTSQFKQVFKWQVNRESSY